TLRREAKLWHPRFVGVLRVWREMNRDERFRIVRAFNGVGFWAIRHPGADFETEADKHPLLRIDHDVLVAYLDAAIAEEMRELPSWARLERYGDRKPDSPSAARVRLSIVLDGVAPEGSLDAWIYNLRAPKGSPLAE